MPLEFGPPAIQKPSWELLGDELLALGRNAEAEQAYQAALARAPGRTAPSRARSAPSRPSARQGLPRKPSGLGRQGSTSTAS